MGELASNISNDRKEKLKKNKIDILKYQHPPTIDSTKIGIREGIQIMAIIKYGKINMSIQVNETQSPNEILGN